MLGTTATGSQHSPHSTSTINFKLSIDTPTQNQRKIFSKHAIMDTAIALQSACCSSQNNACQESSEEETWKFVCDICGLRFRTLRAYKCHRDSFHNRDSWSYWLIMRRLRTLIDCDSFLPPCLNITSKAIVFQSFLSHVQSVNKSNLQACLFKVLRNSKGWKHVHTKMRRCVCDATR